MAVAKSKIGLSPQETEGMDHMMDHEGRLGYIEGRMESFATKEDIAAIKTEVATLKSEVELSVTKAISSQNKWIAGSVLLPIILAAIGWLLWGIEFFGRLQTT